MTNENKTVDVAALDLLCDKLDCGDANHRSIAEQIRKAMKGVKPQLPEGIEWPRFEDGELVKFGDEFEKPNGGIESVECVSFARGKDRDIFSFINGFDLDTITPLKPYTLEDLRNDAEEFVKSLGDGKNATYVFTLLERQRKLMGGE